MTSSEVSRRTQMVTAMWLGALVVGPIFTVLAAAVAAATGLGAWQDVTAGLPITAALGAGVGCIAGICSIITGHRPWQAAFATAALDAAALGILTASLHISLRAFVAQALLPAILQITDAGAIGYITAVCTVQWTETRTQRHRS